MMAGRVRRQAGLMLLAAWLALSPAAADVVHTVRFAAPPQALVWAGEGAPRVVTAGGQPAAVSGGLLWPTDAMNIPAGRFAIASNTGFAVDLLVPDGGLPDGLGASVALKAAGPLADAGAPPQGAVLALMPGARLRLLDWPRKTAARPGPPDRQALHFKVTLTGAGGEALPEARRDAVLERLAVIVTPHRLD